MLMCLVPQPGGFVHDLVRGIGYGPADKGEKATPLGVTGPTFNDTDGGGFSLRLENPQRLSMAAWVNFTETAGSGTHEVIYYKPTGNGHSLTALHYAGGFNYKLHMRFQTNAANRGLSAPSGGLDLENYTNIPLLLGGSVDVTSHQEIYQQGEQVASAAFTDSTLTYDASIWHLGENEAAANQWEGQIPFSFIWGRVTTPEEHFALYDPPTRWDFAYEVGRVFFSIPAGGGTVEGGATLAASFQLSAAAQAGFNVSASLAASMNLTAAAGIASDVSASLVASLDIAAASDITLEASAALGASLDLATAAELVAEVAATLASSTELSDGGQVDYNGQLALGASSNLSAAGALLKEVSATLAASLNVTTAGEVTTGGIEASATLAASFDLSTASELIAEAAAALGCSTAMTASSIATLLTNAGFGSSFDLVPVAGRDTDASAAILWSCEIAGVQTTIAAGLLTPAGRTVIILADNTSVSVLEDSTSVIVH